MDLSGGVQQIFDFSLNLRRTSYFCAMNEFIMLHSIETARKHQRLKYNFVQQFFQS